VPAAVLATGAKTCAARANVREGDALRITAHGAAIPSPFMMTALALVDASFDAYLGLARNVRSPGPASSIFATRRISIAASPSTGHSKRRASSPSVTISRISRGRRGHLLDEASHFGHVQAVRDIGNHAVTGRGIERKRASQLGQRRARHNRPGDLVQALDRTPPRQKVTDDREGKQIAENVGSWNQGHGYRGDERQAMKDQPIAMMI